MSEIAIIVAIDSGFGFAKEGKIPWHYSKDFKHFRSLTEGHICVMGRNTYTDINERLGEKAKIKVLPKRDSLVVSTQLNQDAIRNASVFSSMKQINDVIDTIKDEEPNTNIFFIGGQMIFNEALQIVDTLYITHIQKNYYCDQFFDMDYVQENFTIADIKLGESSELTFIKYIRNK